VPLIYPPVRVTPPHPDIIYSHPPPFYLKGVVGGKGFKKGGGDYFVGVPEKTCDYSVAIVEYISERPTRGVIVPG
jgi:hypothetical protein